MTKFLGNLLTEELVADTIRKNQDKVKLVKSKPTSIGWFVGKVMQASKGTANPVLVTEILKQRFGL